MIPHKLYRLERIYEKAFGLACPLINKLLAFYLERNFNDDNAPLDPCLINDAEKALIYVEYCVNEIFETIASSPAAEDRPKNPIILRLGVEILIFWHALMGAFENSEKYYNAFFALYPRNFVNPLTFFYAQCKILFLSEKDDLDDAIEIFRKLYANDIPKRHYYPLAITAYYICLLAEKARDLTKSLASYQELVKITDDFYSLINSQRGGKLALIQAPQRNPDANADNHPPNGNSILPFSLKISLVPPPPKEFEDNIKTIPDKENNVYDEGYGIDLSSEFHYSNIAKIDNYAENPTFFDDNLDKIVFIQAKALSKLSPFLISLGRADEVNAFFDKVLSYDISSAEKFALHSLSVPISTAYANNASVNRNILPFAEKFHQKCFSFFTEDSAADLENYAALLYQLHITYVALSKNSELAPSLSLKAMEIFGKLKKITVTSRFITERKAKMAVNEITRIGYAGESFEYSRETLNYLLSLKAITDDDRLKTILDEKSLAEQKLRGYLSAICGLLMKHQSDVAISLYRESVKLYANYPENIWWQFKTLAQFVLYFTSDNAFNKEKALEFFYLIKIDSDTPADIAEQRLVLSNNVKTAFWRRNLLADIINFEKSIS